MRIPLAKPEIGAAERDAAARVLAGTTLACGPEIGAFEREYAAYVGTCGAVAVSSGTSGLVAALSALGIGPGAEVLVPAFTFVATVNAVLHAGATPVLVDVDPVTMGMSTDTARTALSPTTRALLVVHPFGRPLPMAPLAALAAEHGLHLIEDACEAEGARDAGRPVGGIGDVGVFGFYPNKPVTTGEGGMIVTNDEQLLAHCRAAINQGRDGAHWVSAAMPGHSARMTEVSAAIGRAQLESLDARLTRLAAVAARYQDALAGSPLGLPELRTDDAERSWFTYPVLLPIGSDRSRVMARLAAAGIGSAAYFPPLHRIPGLADQLVMRTPLPVSEDLGTRLLSLPLWSGMSESEVAEVCEVLLGQL